MPQVETTGAERTFQAHEEASLETVLGDELGPAFVELYTNISILSEALTQYVEGSPTGDLRLQFSDGSGIDSKAASRLSRYIDYDDQAPGDVAKLERVLPEIGELHDAKNAYVAAIKTEYINAIDELYKLLADVGPYGSIDEQGAAELGSALDRLTAIKVAVPSVEQTESNLCVVTNAIIFKAVQDGLSKLPTARPSTTNLVGLNLSVLTPDQIKAKAEAQTRDSHYTQTLGDLGETAGALNEAFSTVGANLIEPIQVLLTEHTKEMYSVLLQAYSENVKFVMDIDNAEDRELAMQHALTVDSEIGTVAESIYELIHIGGVKAGAMDSVLLYMAERRLLHEFEQFPKNEVSTGLISNMPIGETNSEPDVMELVLREDDLKLVQQILGGGSVDDEELTDKATRSSLKELGFDDTLVGIVSALLAGQTVRLIKIALDLEYTEHEVPDEYKSLKIYELRGNLNSIYNAIYSTNIDDFISIVKNRHQRVAIWTKVIKAVDLVKELIED